MFYFILTKIILRSIIAFIPIIIIYSIGFGVFQLVLWQYDASGFSYGDMYAWIVIGVLTLFYPINYIWLWLFFSPLEALVNNRIIKNARMQKWMKKNPILQGNFAPYNYKQSYGYEIIDIVKGEVPNDINGVYLRNGPNPIHFPPSGLHHWFDGDALIHAIRITNG